MAFSPLLIGGIGDTYRDNGGVLIQEIFQSPIDRGNR